MKTEKEVKEENTKISKLINELFKKIKKLLKEYLDEGKTGKIGKEGFYKYDI